MASDHIPEIIDALPAPTIVINADQRVHATNPPADALLGAGLVGKHYIAALRQPALLDAIGTVSGGVGPVQTRYATRDGTKDTTYSVMVAAAGPYTILSFVDQTASEDANKMRRDFVANVSHELRTPLTALLGFIQTLGGAARNDPDARERFLGIMAREANRMTRLVDDLLSLSRVEEDERIRPKTSVEMGRLLSSVIKGLEPQITDAGVTVELDVQTPVETVPGDAGQLIQVFTNLVENSIKYGGQGSTVRVTQEPRTHHARLRADGVLIKVSDDGEGIASHHLARLTERFYRVDNHRSREVGGTGLGLAIVKHIINRHRGRLIIESELGKGTDISVILPSDPLS
ncbi:ATP-binding protein [Yoonia sp. SS1-5]|uniref:histidine kinase n=1 Tax=Yoonia rhodophyticola TaxID=3137370 RepID=A0AAN0M7N6_9RHOB